LDCKVWTLFLFLCYVRFVAITENSERLHQREEKNALSTLKLSLFCNSTKLSIKLTFVASAIMYRMAETSWLERHSYIFYE
jgi:hypothetical protein